MYGFVYYEKASVLVISSSIIAVEDTSNRTVGRELFLL